MTTTADSRTLDDVLKDLRFAMVGTADGNDWHSRPLSLAEQKGSILRFLVSSDAEWVQALETGGSPSSVTFSDPGKNTYVALQGSARTVDHRSVIDRIWNPGAAAYFDGKDDPTIRVLEVTVRHGEWWDGPSGRLGQLLSMAKAALGQQPGGEGTVTT